MLSPVELTEKVSELQHLPFAGVTVRSIDFCYPFYNKTVDGEAVEVNVRAMSKIEWGKFTDNFMWMVTGDNVDWFDEAAWGDDGYTSVEYRSMARQPGLHP